MRFYASKGGVPLSEIALGTFNVSVTLERDPASPRDDGRGGMGEIDVSHRLIGPRFVFFFFFTLVAQSLTTTRQFLTTVRQLFTSVRPNWRGGMGEIDVSHRLIGPRCERDFFIDNLLVRIHFIIVMIRWTGLAPWEFEFPHRPQVGLGVMGRVTERTRVVYGARDCRGGREPPLALPPRGRTQRHVGRDRPLQVPPSSSFLYYSQA